MCVSVLEFYYYSYGNFGGWMANLEGLGRNLLPKRKNAAVTQITTGKEGKHQCDMKQ